MVREGSIFRQDYFLGKFVEVFGSIREKIVCFFGGLGVVRVILCYGVPSGFFGSWYV